MDGNWIIGVDEAGRGPVIGPLVVAALAIPPEDINILSKLEVKDSKEISHSQRLLIFDEINRHIEDGRWKSGLIFMNWYAEYIYWPFEYFNSPHFNKNRLL